jgi:hypothetical protein
VLDGGGSGNDGGGSERELKTELNILNDSTCRG